MDRPELREKILHEICLPCIHKCKIIPSGIAGSDVKTIEKIPCEYEGTNKYCRLAHKAADQIQSLLIPDIEEAKREAYNAGLDDATHDAYNAGFEQGKFEEGERIVGVIEGYNSIDFPYGGDFKSAILQSLKSKEKVNE